MRKVKTMTTIKIAEEHLHKSHAERTDCALKFGKCWSEASRLYGDKTQSSWNKPHGAFPNDRYKE